MAQVAFITSADPFQTASKQHGGGTKLKLNSEQLAILAELIESNNDATLAELCVMLKERTGGIVSIATMGRMTNRLNITVKKNSVPRLQVHRQSAKA